MRLLKVFLHFAQEKSPETKHLCFPSTSWWHEDEMELSLQGSSVPSFLAGEQQVCMLQPFQSHILKLLHHLCRHMKSSQKNPCAYKCKMSIPFHKRNNRKIWSDGPAYCPSTKQVFESHHWNQKEGTVEADKRKKEVLSSRDRYLEKPSHWNVWAKLRKTKLGSTWINSSLHVLLRRDSWLESTLSCVVFDAYSLLWCFSSGVNLGHFHSQNSKLIVSCEWAAVWWIHLPVPSQCRLDHL